MGKFFQFPEHSQFNRLLNERYRILQSLSKGHSEKTFLAVDEKSQVHRKNVNSLEKSTPQLCVIQQFLPQYHSIHHGKNSQLFNEEFLKLVEIGTHPQIPQLLDTFVKDEQQYLVQEWIHGQTLEAELTEIGAFNEVKIRQLLQALLPVLQFVHNHQVIHRNIKPANIIRRQSDGQLVIVNFGSAKFTNSKKLEKTPILIGSPEYTAPEQIRGKALFASDLYSLGVTCLRLLTHKLPFDLYDCGENTWIWQRHLKELMSPSLEQILRKLLQGGTKRRYQSATQVLIDVNVSSKDVVVPSVSDVSKKTNEQDFEAPYFGFGCKQNLPISITADAAALDIRSIAPLALFNPQIQAWYYRIGFG